MEKEKPRTAKEIERDVRKAEFIAEFKERERKRNSEY